MTGAAGFDWRRLGAPNRPAASDDAGSLGDRARRLTAALAEAGAQIDPAVAGPAQQVAARVSERVALSDRHTVVALAGVTGGGKSSLFNAIIGDGVAEVGVRRPITSQTQAAVWGESAATPLLDWLQVSRRHRVTDAGDGLDGLVLLDLPDFDSRVAANRAEADRILELADLFVWVTDPQKYADAVMHDEYIAARRGHADHTIVVLNHADALHGDGLATATDDLVRLLRADGLADPQVVATSATTGLGIPELRTRIARAVAAHEATRRRLAVDLDQQREVVRATLGDAAPTVDDAAERRLVDALAVAAGVPAVRDAVVHDHLRRASAHTGSVFVRWVRHLRPGPLRRLGLGDTAPDAAGAPQRSSLPTPSPAAQAEVEVAGRALADGAARGLPPRWADAVQDTAVPDNADLRDALDQAVAGTALDARTAVWWRVVGVVQWLLGLTVVLGVGWYALILLTQSLQFALPDVPRWGPVPYPFLMIVTGLVAGFLLAGLSRTLAGVGARRRAARVEARLRAAVAVVARERVVDPVREVLARRRRVGELLGA